MDLNKELVNEIIAISKKYDSIYKVVLFGSRAREDNDLKSDIDLAIYSNSDILEFIEEVENTTHTLLEFDFSDMQLTEPFTPEKYIEAINDAVDSGFKVLIIDSISHEWNYCVDIHDKMPGNS